MWSLLVVVIVVLFECLSHSLLIAKVHAYGLDETSTVEDLIKYKKQRNLVVKLNKNCKKEFFDNLETKNNSKSFWDKCKPYFSNKHSKGDSDILLNYY